MLYNTFMKRILITIEYDGTNYCGWQKQPKVKTIQGEIENAIFRAIGENVDVRVSKNTVEVFYHSARVAAHVRISSYQREPIVKTEHMPEAHRKYLQYNKEDFETWAVTVGPNTEKVVQHFLNAGKEVEQA